jgi:2-polyprenyl-6-methoxyphenol hydroxylase-like FAD-dependent oxidoreductase
MVAGELAAAGVSTTVLERRAEVGNLTRAFAVHARTLEMLDARGLADDTSAGASDSRTSASITERTAERPGKGDPRARRTVLCTPSAATT